MVKNKTSKTSLTKTKDPIEKSQHLLMGGIFSPVIDFYEEKNSYYIFAELPGINEKDFKVEIDGDELILVGEKKEDANKQKLFRKERLSGPFYRKIKLPQKVNPKNMKKTFDNGILNIIIKKK